MDEQLGLNQSVGAGPLQTAPWNQLHALPPRITSQTAPRAPLNVVVDSLAGQMFNQRYSSMHLSARGCCAYEQALDLGVLAVSDVSACVAA